MPTYDYECEKCHQTFEVEQKISDPPLETCSASRPDDRFDVSIQCGGHLRRLISAKTSFALKGGGWFKDGY